MEDNKNLIYFLKPITSVIYWLSDFLLCCCVPKRRADKLCIVKLDAIGDFVVFQTFLNDIQELSVFSGGDVLLLGNIKWKEIAETFHEETFSSLYFIDPIKFVKNPFYRLQCAVRIRRLGIKTIINPTRAREFLIDDSIVRLSGAKVSIGSKSNTNNTRRFLLDISDRWYSRLIIEPDAELFEFDWYRSFFRKLGKEYSHTHPVLDLTKLTTVKTWKELAGKNYCVFGIGGYWSGKRWEMEKFARAAREIWEQYSLVPVLVGSGSDMQTSVETIHHDSALPWVNFTGKLSLVELISIVSRADLVISNDTSVYHIGVATKVNNVCILGGGHFGQFGPYPEQDVLHSAAVFHEDDCFHCNWYCPYHKQSSGPVPCIRAITVDEVMHKVSFLLNR